MATNRLQMPPMFSAPNIADRGFANPIFGSYYAAISVVVSYCKGLCFGKFMTAITESPCPNKPALLTSILKLLKVCSEKKMVGVDAGGSVAMMADKLPCWNWSSINFPRCSMRQCRPSRFHDSEYSVSPLVLVCGPYPATRGNLFSDMLHKSFLYRLLFSWVMSTWHNLPPLFFSIVYHFEEVVNAYE